MNRRDFIKGLAAGAALTLAGCPRREEDRRGWDLPPFTGGKTGLVADPIYLRHRSVGDHVETPARYASIIAALRAAGLEPRLTRLAPRAATVGELGMCHREGYIRTVQREVKAGRKHLSTGGTYLCARSFEVALRAAGGLFAAVDAVMQAKVRNAFCVVRPPGHHAGPGKGMGFCIFSNIALAARYAQRRHGIRRVAIVDWDVHHGNGTQEMFWRDGSVFTFDTHQHPLFPGTGLASEVGDGAGKGTTMNCPFPAGAGRSEILGALEDRFEDEMKRFKPELVLISCGFDSRINDPLGKFKLTDRDYADMTRVVMRVARRHAAERVISTLEGGYNLRGIGLAAAAHVGMLLAG
jgi:acetoin utilization deacetylase AcuC-like enzyme